MEERFEVIIVGGGIAGASVGAAIAGRRTTLILEAEGQCGYHSTGRSAAFYLESYGGPEVAKLTRASHAFLVKPPAEFSETGFLRQRGALHISTGGWPKFPSGIDVRRVDRAELERMVPGLRPQWHRAMFEHSCADINVAGLHAAYLRTYRKRGGRVAENSRLKHAAWNGESWRIRLEGGRELSASILVNAAGAWADLVAGACGVPPIGFSPVRRTMLQVRVGQTGLTDLPLVSDAGGSFYFKGQTDNVVWLSPHDEIATLPGDAAPEEIDIAVAIDRFERAVDWPVERIERSWAGLRTFAPDRLPVYGFDPLSPAFFWSAGQGGFGIQSAPAAARMAAAQLLGMPLDETLAQIDSQIFSPIRFRSASG